MNRRAFALVACALVPVAGPAGPAGAGDVPHRTVLQLEAAGVPVSTPFVTRPGRSYGIKVTGVYTFNNTLGFGFADCGHKDPQGPEGWINVGNVLVDGQVAGCASLDFSPTHTYSWSRPGTGEPFTFEIYANAHTDDDTGCLLVEVYQSTEALPFVATKVPSQCWRLK